MDSSLVKQAFENCERLHNNVASLYEALAEGDKKESLEAIDLIELRLMGIKAKING